MTPPADLVDKDALIATLMARIEVLAARVVELEARIGAPRKGSGNSSVPPSQGRKPSGSGLSKRKARPHAGAHRPLHPSPASKRDVFAGVCGCGADVSGVLQTARETYDCIEIPWIEPDVTQVTLRGGACPCCAKPFKARAPEGLEPGSPYGPNVRALVFYLRFVQCIPLARLAGLLFDMLGLEISEGGLVNAPDGKRLVVQPMRLPPGLFLFGSPGADSDPLAMNLTDAAGQIVRLTPT